MNEENRQNLNLPKRLAGMEDLAENLWWSWHPAARSLFKTRNRRIWKESIHNPDKMLKELPQQCSAFFRPPHGYGLCEEFLCQGAAAGKAVIAGLAGLWRWQPERTKSLPEVAVESL